jgi:hypothetical protein
MLIATDENQCKDSLVISNLVDISGPRGTFNYTPLDGCTNLQVTFTLQIPSSTDTNQKPYRPDTVYIYTGNGNVVMLSGDSMELPLLTDLYTTGGSYIPIMEMIKHVNVGGVNHECRVEVQGNDTIFVIDAIKCDKFAVTVLSNNSAMGSVSGDGFYAENSSATLTATANNGYVLGNWTSNGVVLSTVNPFTFTVTSDTTIVANFKTTIGISETTTPSGIVLYPNPVEEILHIQSSTAIEQATIYDMSGRLLRQVQRTNDIPVQDLARGVYVIKIETKKGIEIGKIVKQ